MEAETKVKEIIMTNNLAEKSRTSATVPTLKLQIFKAVAGLKFEKDPMNSAWEEAVDLFLDINKEYLKKLNIELKDILNEDPE